MPLTSKQSSRPDVLLLPWLVGLLPILLGLAVLYWQAERSLRQEAQHTAGEALAQFELMLDNVSQAARELQPQAGTPCELVTHDLRDQVTRRPFVRSTNLISNGSLYCSSLFGLAVESVDPHRYVDGMLRLMPGNPVTPDRALLVYRLDDGRRGALSTVDGYHLANALRLIGRGTGLVLQVGPAWMSADGKVHSSTPPQFDIAAPLTRSERYPFAIHSGYPAASIWQLMRSEYAGLFGLLVLLGVLCGVTCRWSLNRVQSPRQGLQRALDAQQFLPYYQPIVRASDGQWAGVEVLMRWQHPTEGLVRPDLFIPQAEESGLIVPMTRLLMRQVAAQLAPQAHSLVDGFHISLNITARHFQDAGLYADCKQLLDAFPAGKVSLVLELTERELIMPTPQVHTLFEQLRALGVRLSIDDFGTGHSSLAYLREFRVDYLKIDQSFVAMIGVDALSSHILDSIIELSGKLELGVIAEGVETEAQRCYLAEQKVDFLQGYLYARPMPAAALLAALKAGAAA